MSSRPQRYLGNRIFARPTASRGHSHVEPVSDAVPLYKRLLLSNNPYSTSIPLHILSNRSYGALIDSRILQLIALILKNFIQPWFSKITLDKEFFSVIVGIVVHVIRQLEDRFAHAVDWTALLAHHYPQILKRHVQDFHRAKERLNSPHGGSLDLPGLFHSYQPHVAISLDIPAKQEKTPLVSSLYLRALTDNILKALLPDADIAAGAEMAAIREVILGFGWSNVFGKVAQPWFLNQIIVKLLSAPASPSAKTPDSTGLLSRLWYMASNATDSHESLTQEWLAFLKSCLSLVARSESIITHILSSISSIIELQPFRSIITSYIQSTLITQISPQNLANLMDTVENAVFPNGSLPPAVSDPDIQQQGEIYESAVNLLAAKLPYQFTYLYNPSSGNRQERARQMAIDLLAPWQNWECNVHLFLHLIETTLARLIPEMCE